MQMLNSYGGAGYRYWGDYVITNSTTSLFAKPANSRKYQYEKATTTTSLSTFLNTANSEGARGYRYVGDLMFQDGTYSLFATDTTAAATYSYEALAPQSTSSSFVQQLNSEASKGFKYKGDYVFSGVTSSIYVKDGVSSTLQYAVAPATATHVTDFISMANSQGAIGYRFLNYYSFQDGIQALFVKDSAHSDWTFSYSYEDEASNSTDFLAQINAQGVNNILYMGDRYFANDGAVLKNIYINLNKCQCTNVYIVSPFLSD